MRKHLFQMWNTRLFQIWNKQKPALFQIWNTSCATFCKAFLSQPPVGRHWKQAKPRAQLGNAAASMSPRQGWAGLKNADCVTNLGVPNLRAMCHTDAPGWRPRSKRVPSLESSEAGVSKQSGEHATGNRCPHLEHTRVQHARACSNKKGGLGLRHVCFTFEQHGHRVDNWCRVVRRSLQTLMWHVPKFGKRPLQISSARVAIPSPKTHNQQMCSNL